MQNRDLLEKIEKLLPRLALELQGRRVEPRPSLVLKKLGYHKSGQELYEHLKAKCPVWRRELEAEEAADARFANGLPGNTSADLADVPANPSPFTGWNDNGK